MSISENIAAIRQQIALAAERSGRTAADITLVGASKMNDAAACREAIAAGIDALGENRVQEMTQKLAEIEKTAEKLSLVQDILLEVNIGGEEAKSGFAPEELEAAARYAKTLSHVQVLGLMTIPPVENEPQGNLPFFAKMKALYVDINQNIYDNKLKYLSMGMSGDYAEAIEAGSNMVRVGTAIFGARNYSK